MSSREGADFLLAFPRPPLYDVPCPSRTRFSWEDQPMRSRSARRRSFRPRVEALEGRALPSVCLVDRLTDVGEGKGMAGDPRYYIEQS